NRNARIKATAYACSPSCIPPLNLPWIIYCTSVLFILIANGDMSAADTYFASRDPANNLRIQLLLDNMNTHRQCLLCIISEDVQRSLSDNRATVQAAIYKVHRNACYLHSILQRLSNSIDTWEANRRYGALCRWRLGQWPDYRSASVGRLR